MLSNHNKILKKLLFMPPHVKGGRCCAAFLFSSFHIGLRSKLIFPTRSS